MSAPNLTPESLAELERLYGCAARERDELRAELNRINERVFRAFGYMPIIPGVALTVVDHNIDVHVSALADEWVVRERQLSAEHARAEKAEARAKELEESDARWSVFAEECGRDRLILEGQRDEARRERAALLREPGSEVRNERDDLRLRLREYEFRADKAERALRFYAADLDYGQVARDALAQKEPQP